LPINKQVDILTDEIVLDGDETCRELLLEKLGVSSDTYLSIVKDSSFQKVMSQKSQQYNVAPKMSKIHKRLVEDAVAGDAQALKMVLQMTGSLAPETVVIEDKRLEHMDPMQLMKHLKGLEEDLKELTDGSERV
jgi:hypothetical protein